MMALRNLFGDLALDFSVRQIAQQLNRSVGDWGYLAGIEGAEVVVGGKRIMTITVTAPETQGATFVVNGGVPIVVPRGATLTINPNGNLTDPALLFTGTASYFIDYVTGQLPDPPAPPGPGPNPDVFSNLLVNAAGDRLLANTTDLLLVEGDAPQVTNGLLINAQGDRLLANATDLLAVSGDAPAITDGLLVNSLGDRLLANNTEILSITGAAPLLLANNTDRLLANASDFIRVN